MREGVFCLGGPQARFRDPAGLGEDDPGAPVGPASLADVVAPRARVDGSRIDGPSRLMT